MASKWRGERTIGGARAVIAEVNPFVMAPIRGQIFDPNSIPLKIPPLFGFVVARVLRMCRSAMGRTINFSLLLTPTRT